MSGKLKFKDDEVANSAKEETAGITKSTESPPDVEPAADESIDKHDIVGETPDVDITASEPLDGTVINAGKSVVSVTVDEKQSKAKSRLDFSKEKKKPTKSNREKGSSKRSKVAESIVTPNSKLKFTKEEKEKIKQERRNTKQQVKIYKRGKREN